MSGKRKMYRLSDGFCGNLHQLAEHASINYSTLKHRIRRGLPVEEAVWKPLDAEKMEKQLKLADGFAGNVQQVARHVNINVNTLYARLKSGMPLEEAVSKPVQHHGKRTL